MGKGAEAMINAIALVGGILLSVALLSASMESHPYPMPPQHVVKVKAVRIVEPLP